MTPFEIENRWNVLMRLRANLDNQLMEFRQEIKGECHHPIVKTVHFYTEDGWMDCKQYQSSVHKCQLCMCEINDDEIPEKCNIERSERNLGV